MKRLFLFWLAASLPALAGLKFEKTSEKLEAPPESTVVKAEFKFRNDGTEAATLVRADAGCSCVVVTINGVQLAPRGPNPKKEGAKQVEELAIAPGAEGKIEADFDISNFSGETMKEIGVWLKGQAEDQPEAVLTFTVKVPVLILAEPKTVFWDIGSKPEPKTVTLTMNYSKPIHIEEITGANTNYSQELKTIEDGRKYELVLTPKDTSKADIAVFHIETDCDIVRHRSQRVFCSVRKPVPAAAAPAAGGKP